VSEFAFSPDGKLLALGMGSSVALADAETGKVKWSSPAHEGNVNVLAFSADGKTVLTAAHDRAVRLIGLLREGKKYANLAVPDPTPDGVDVSGGNECAGVEPLFPVEPLHHPLMPRQMLDATSRPLPLNRMFTQHRCRIGEQLDANRCQPCAKARVRPTKLRGHRQCHLSQCV
jgi:hypothetical protein